MISRLKEQKACTAHGGGYRCQAEGCDKHALKGGRCIAHGGTGWVKRCKIEGCDKFAKVLGHCKAHRGGNRRKVDNPSIPGAPEGLSEDEKHHVGLAQGEGENEGEVVDAQASEEHHVDLVEAEGEDEVVDTQVRCVW